MLSSSFTKSDSITYYDATTNSSIEDLDVFTLKVMAVLSRYQFIRHFCFVFVLIYSSSLQQKKQLDSFKDIQLFITQWQSTNSIKQNNHYIFDITYHEILFFLPKLLQDSSWPAIQLLTQWEEIFSTYTALKTDSRNVTSQALMNVPAQNWCNTTDKHQPLLSGECHLICSQQDEYQPK